MPSYLLDRFKETSTLRGIVIAICGLIGYSLSEADAVQLIAAGNILAGIVGAALPDKLAQQ